MWMYPGPRCLNHPFSIELGDMETNTQIRGLLAHGADLNLGSGPIPLREGVDNTWVSSLGISFGCLCRFQLLIVCVFLRRISGTHAAPCGGSLYLRMWCDGRPTMPTANCCGHVGKRDGTGASPMWQQGRGVRKLPLSPSPQDGMMKRRMKMERRGEVTPPPHSPSPEDLPSLGDIFSRRVGISISMHQPKWPRTEVGSSTGLPLQLRLALVSPDLQGVSVVPEVIVMSRLLVVLQVSSFSSTARVAMTTMAISSSSGVSMQIHWPRKPALDPSCLCPLGMALFVGSPAPIFLVPALTLKVDAGGRSRTSSATIIHRPSVHLVMPHTFPWWHQYNGELRHLQSQHRRCRSHQVLMAHR
jgi:hypothetical protein